MSKKYNRSSGSVAVKVLKIDGNYAAGSISFAPGQTTAGQGQFLAFKKDGDWQIVYEGNGSVDCDKMRHDYGFSEIILQSNFCDPEDLGIEAVIRTYIASNAGVAEDAINIISIDNNEWSDGCLALGRPDEGCAAVITPGYKVIVKVNGVEMKYRTNIDGSEIRREE